VSLLVTACGGPAPAPSPTASPVPPTLDIATDIASPSAEPLAQASPAAPRAALAPVSPAAASASSTAPPGASPSLALAPISTPISLPSSTPTVLAAPEPERLLVNGSGSPAVNMRSEPGTNSGVVKSVRDGAEVVVIGTDRESDGRIWRNVQDGDTPGWIVSTALRPIPTPTVTPSTTPTSAATSTAAATPTPPTTATATPTPGASAEPEGEPVEVFGTGQGANLRAEPGTSGPLIQKLQDGTHLTIIGPDRDVAGLTWRHVRGEGGTEGWIVADAVRSLATPSPTPTASATPTPAATPTSADATSTPAGTSTPTATPAPGEPPAPADTPSEEPAPEGEEPTPAPETVEVYGTGGTGANLRVQPGRSATVIRSVPDGDHLTVVGDDETADGISWRHVQAEDGATGWLAGEVVRTLVTPTATPRPGAPGIGAPLAGTPEPESQLSEAELAARPCRPGQVKGDASSGTYYTPDHPEYPGLLQRVRCFDDAARARASGFRPPDASDASPTPAP
jgi:uncharacterized protein YgiM (DUF1202 family)